MADDPDNGADNHNGEQGNHNGTFPFSTQAVQPLSKVLQETYKLGGWALVLILTFLVLVFAAFFLAQSGKSTAGYVAFGLAAVILVYLGFETVFPVHRMVRDLKTNKEMLDTVQNSALRLAYIVRQINLYALQNSGQIVEAVERARVSLAGIPVAERVLSLPMLSHTENLGNQIRKLSDECDETMNDIADSISKAERQTIPPWQLCQPWGPPEEAPVLPADVPGRTGDQFRAAEGGRG